MEKIIIQIGRTLIYAVENSNGYTLLPCASCQYEAVHHTSRNTIFKEESSGEHCNNCCNGTENNFINKGCKHGTLQ